MSFQLCWYKIIGYLFPGYVDRLVRAIFDKVDEVCNLIFDQKKTHVNIVKKHPWGLIPLVLLLWVILNDRDLRAKLLIKYCQNDGEFKLLSYQGIGIPRKKLSANNLGDYYPGRALADNIHLFWLMIAIENASWIEFSSRSNPMMS